MAYQPRPNASADTLVASRDQIRTNFEIIQSDFAVNHGGLGAANNGKHLFMQMPAQIASPLPGTLASENALYTRSVGAVTNMYMRSESNGEEYQLTSVKDADIATFGTGTAYSGTMEGGWTFLPGGLILQYGTLPTTATSGTITFPFAFSTAVFSINITKVNSSAAAVSVDTVILASFNYHMGGVAVASLYWMAIGK